MLDRLARRWYERLGTRYKFASLATQIPASVLVALGVVGVVAAYYHPSLSDALLIAAATSAFTAAGVGRAISRQREALAGIANWGRQGKPSAAETAAAWDAATNFPMRSFRRDSLTTNAIAALPSVAVMVIVLGLPVSAYPVVLAAGLIAAAYGTIVTYSIAELLVRPAVERMAAALPADFQFTRNGLPLHRRLVITLPVFTAMTGLVVAALVSDGGGTRALAIGVAVSLAVGLALSFELTLLLSRAITDPIAHLRDALARVRDGDLEVRVPVLSSDELGDLSDAFNRMVRGLAEREQLRTAFGTYLDKDVAGFILSGTFPDGGVEAEVSIMFCDVPDFTPFAERASPAEIVNALNALFEILVPIIGRHGGHVDKFMGDGLLAVFGAPEGYSDHADRALSAGLEILDAVESSKVPFGVCIGINTGRVVAGSIGGGGRLNFSVIGDPVNVAARVEAATRETGDDLLLTRATRDALVRPAVLASRGSISLKGKSDPIELLAPPRNAEAAARAADAVGI
ncbi:MAG: HAMP domain-containing protein [Actinomycetota bacterium]|nr:HAMP domain-containing protein [Actinomycetota bacterium]